MPRCDRCQILTRNEGRGLCRRCYDWVRRHGNLEQYPTRNAGTQSLYCKCRYPLPTPLVYFGGEYCGDCGKPFRPQPA